MKFLQTGKELEKFFFNWSFSAPKHLHKTKKRRKV